MPYQFLQIFIHVSFLLILGKLFLPFGHHPIYLGLVIASSSLALLSYVAKLQYEDPEAFMSWFTPIGIVIWAFIVIMNVIEFTRL